MHLKKSGLIENQASAMKIWYFSFRKDSPSVRYRGLRLLNHLSSLYGIQFCVLYPTLKSQLIIFLLILRSAIYKNNSEIFIFQKLSKPSFYVFLCKMLVKCIKNTFFDIDDALYAIRDDSIINYFAKNCTAVLVASENLLTHFNQINNKTFLLTTPIYPSYTHKKQKNNLFTIGWVGTYFSHRENLLQILFPALMSVQYPVKVVILGVTTETERNEISGYFSTKKGILLETPLFSNWDVDMELSKEISKFDLGVSPLIDNEMNRGRSAFKIKQYQNIGIPVLASPVGDNIKYIKDYYNGFLCDTQEDWVKRINLFYSATDREYNKYCQRSLNSFFRSDYQLNVVAEAMYKIINGISVK